MNESTIKLLINTYLNHTGEIQNLKKEIKVQEEELQNIRSRKNKVVKELEVFENDLGFDLEQLYNENINKDFMADIRFRNNIEVLDSKKGITKE